jgi:hypothetical protein
LSFSFSFLLLPFFFSAGFSVGQFLEHSPVDT